MSAWREYYRPIIANVLAKCAGQTDAEIRRALCDAYPCAYRRGYAYREWRAEVRAQRDTEAIQRRRRVQQIAEGQGVLL